MKVITDWIEDILTRFYYFVKIDVALAWVLDWTIKPLGTFIIEFVKRDLITNFFIFVLICMVFGTVCTQVMAKKFSKCRNPKILIKWDRKCAFKYHVMYNEYRYGIHKERRYDRQTFGVEEQIFQQCVPTKVLINLQNVDLRYRRNILSENKKYSEKYDLFFENIIHKNVYITYLYFSI
jgi:hypothetical protein